MRPARLVLLVDLLDRLAPLGQLVRPDLLDLDFNKPNKPQNYMSNAQIDEQSKREHAVVDQKTAAARDSQVKLEGLQRTVTQCETALNEFESKRQFLSARRQQLLDQVTTLWPMLPGNLVLSPSIQPTSALIESHTTILAINATMADAPRAKVHLDAQLKAAQKALSDFERQN